MEIFNIKKKLNLSDKEASIIAKLIDNKVVDIFRYITCKMLLRA